MPETTNQDIEKARQGAQNANDDWKEELDRVDALGEENAPNTTGEIDWKVEYTTVKSVLFENLDAETVEMIDRRVRELGGIPLVD